MGSDLDFEKMRKRGRTFKKILKGYDVIFHRGRNNEVDSPL